MNKAHKFMKIGFFFFFFCDGKEESLRILRMKETKS